MMKGLETIGRVGRISGNLRIAGTNKVMEAIAENALWAFGPHSQSDSG